jgi:hypothetical protein
MRQHSARKKKKKTHELADPTQKDNRKKQVLIILEGNAQKSLQAKGKKKIEDTSWTCRIQQKMQKSEDMRRHFSACFKPIFSLLKPRDTSSGGRVLFSDRKSVQNVTGA